MPALAPARTRSTGTRRESTDERRRSPETRRETTTSRGESGDGPEVAEGPSTEIAVILLSVAAVVGGSLLPWGTTLGEPVYGYEAAGLWTFVLGIVAGGVAYWYGWTARTMMTMVLVGALVSAMALSALSGAGLGVYVTLLAGGTLYVAGVRGYQAVRAAEGRTDGTART